MRDPNGNFNPALEVEYGCASATSNRALKIL
jgi:hypothetical protein